ncbi:MAG: energy-coupling factor ABC transporter ATP-binding protein [Aigarchaeota archaeon]|nr:energy-coupling factor ABC transporter ATP-binding protein [Aigarchaeota archaeon]MDW7986808.1 ABC transporter ATP-binding protein [Nitrososphaerota archaeon]
MLRLHRARAKRVGWTSPPIDLEVRSGELAAIIGSSGSGKTSILLSAIGLLDYEGSITFNGEEVKKADKRELRSRMAFVPDEYDSYIITSRVVDEIAFNLENQGYAPEEVAEKILRTLETTHLLNLWSREVWTLSGGERQRLVIASALSTSPTIILLDNPFSSIDWNMRRELSRIVVKLLEENRIVVYTGYSILKDMPKPDHIAYLGELRGSYSSREPLKKDLERSVLLDVRDVWFRYVDGSDVLRGISFTAFRKEVLTLLGRNGVGKTTLLKIISGLLKPRSGKVLIDGREARPGLCIYVSQNPSGLLIGKTPREEFRYVGESEAWKIVEELGFGYLLDKPIHSLSLGEKRLISLLSTLSYRSPLIALDEPTVGLDYYLRGLVGELVQKASSKNVGVIMATHDRAFAETFSDRMLILEGGVILEASKA